jgi:TonB family protein
MVRAMRVSPLAQLLILSACFVRAEMVSAQSSPMPPSPGSKPLAIFAPKPVVPTEARVRRIKGAGIFAAHVRPDGTVARVETLQSTGSRILDKASIDAFSRWRFVPGSVKKVKIPVQYTGDYPQGSVDW